MASSIKRKAKVITNKDDLDMIVNMTTEEAKTKQIIMDLFGDFGKGSRFNPYDIIEIPAGKYGNKKKNKSKFTTTIGLWIFNKSFLEHVSHIVGYINETVNADKYDDISQTLSFARLEDKISLEDLKQWIIQSQLLMNCCSILAPSHTDMTFDMSKDIAKKKKELYKKYKEGIDAKDLTAIKAYEDELIDFTKDLIHDDPFADLYNSGARSKYADNLRPMYLDRGPVHMTDGSYDVILSSYMEGLQPNEFAVCNDAAVGGPYSRSRRTASGGYLEKLYTSLGQHLILDEEGSDCGTKETIKVTLTKKNINDWMYCFVKEGSKLVEITTDNRSKYIGKTVDMRFSSLCHKKKGRICEKCIGTRFRRIGIKNVGLSCMIPMSSIKLASMKQFHISTINLYTIDPDDVFM